MVSQVENNWKGANAIVILLLKIVPNHLTIIWQKSNAVVFAEHLEGIFSDQFFTKLSKQEMLFVNAHARFITAKIK